MVCCPYLFRILDIPETVGQCFGHQYGFTTAVDKTEDFFFVQSQSNVYICLVSLFWTTTREIIRRSWICCSLHFRRAIPIKVSSNSTMPTRDRWRRRSTTRMRIRISNWLGSCYWWCLLLNLWCGRSWCGTVTDGLLAPLDWFGGSCVVHCFLRWVALIPRTAYSG